MTNPYPIEIYFHRAIKSSDMKREQMKEENKNQTIRKTQDYLFPYFMNNSFITFSNFSFRKASK